MPTYKYEGAYPLIYNDVTVGDVIVERVDPDYTETPDGSTLVLFPGDVVITTPDRKLEHWLLRAVEAEPVTKPKPVRKKSTPPSSDVDVTPAAPIEKD